MVTFEQKMGPQKEIGSFCCCHKMCFASFYEIDTGERIGKKNPLGHDEAMLPRTFAAFFLSFRKIIYLIIGGFWPCGFRTVSFTSVYKIEVLVSVTFKYRSARLMVHIQQKRGIGVEKPSKRSFCSVWVANIQLKAWLGMNVRIQSNPVYKAFHRLF